MSAMFRALGSELRPYTDDAVMVRIRCLMSYPWSRKSFARASSSGLLLGGLVARMSSTGSTMPRPIRSAHTRLAITLAKYGIVGRGHPAGECLARIGFGVARNAVLTRREAWAPVPCPWRVLHRS